jgi:hypothetical protein
MAVVNRYLEKSAPGSAENLDEKIAALRELIQSRGVRLVDYSDVRKLEAVEKQESQSRGVEFFKYFTDEEMLAAIDCAND